jgi:uncharacterized protein
LSLALQEIDAQCNNLVARPSGRPLRGSFCYTSTMKNFFFLLLGLLFLGGCFYLFLKQPAPEKFSSRIEENRFIDIKLGDIPIKAELAITNEEREMGLSGKESLPEGTGMLFVFENPGIYGIWMKDMKFPIDILWLDQDKRIITIKEQVSPDTFPQVFYSEGSAKYVLELPSGFSERNRIDTGLLMSLSREI